MLMNCRFCGTSKNGEIAIRIHEREAHPREYYLNKANNLEKTALNALKEANQLRSRYQYPLQVHDTVMIYEDPITKQKPEGKACLLSKIEDLPDGLERWKICFEGEDGGVHERVIKVK